MEQSQAVQVFSELSARALM